MHFGLSSISRLREPLYSRDPLRTHKAHTDK